MPESDAIGHPGGQVAAIDAGAGPGATAILHGMLETLSEVLGALDQRLGRLEDRLDDVTAGREATAQAVARLGAGMSHLVARLDDLAREDDEPPPPPPPIEVDIDAVADAVASRLDGRLAPLSELGALGALGELHQLSRLDRLDRLDVLAEVDQRLSSLDAANAALLDAVTERLAPIDSLADEVAARVTAPVDALSAEVEAVFARVEHANAAVVEAVGERLAPLAGLPDEVAARVAGPVDGLGEGLRVVLARLGELTESVDVVGSGLGSLSQALAADDGDDGVDVAALVAEESERIRAIVAGLGQAVTAAHGDITATVAGEAERTRVAVSEAVASAVDATAARPDLASALAEEGERTRAALAEAMAARPDLEATLAQEVGAVHAAVASLTEAVSAGSPRLEALVADEGERVRAAVADLGHAVSVDQPRLLELVADESERVRATVAAAGEATAHAVAARVETALHDALVAIEQRHEAVAEALAGLAAAPPGAGTEAMERSLAAAQADLREALDEAVLLVTDRQEVQATAVRQAVDDLRSELARLGDGDDDGPDLALLVSEAAGSSDRAVARMHADLRGTLDDLARMVGDGPEVPDVAAVVAQAAEASQHSVQRMHHELRAALDEVTAVVADRHESYSGQVQQALGSLTQAVGALRGDLSALAERRADEGPDIGALFERHSAEVRQAIDAVAAAVPPAPDIRGALDDALLVLVDRQDRGTDELRQAIGRLRAELAALAESEADEDDGPDVARLLARHAEDARDELTRLETVLRGQVAEVSGRAGSITDVIGRLDGRLHEVVDGVRGLSRHLEATATLVPAVEALRAEVDELRRLYEQPRLRAVNGGE